MRHLVVLAFGVALGSLIPICVHQIQMSLFLPFRNVTPRWLGSDGGRARSPDVAQRPTGATHHD